MTAVWFGNPRLRVILNEWFDCDVNESGCDDGKIDDMYERCGLMFDCDIRFCSFGEENERICKGDDDDDDDRREIECGSPLTRSNSFCTTSIKVSKLVFGFVACLARTRRTTFDAKHKHA